MRTYVSCSANAVLATLLLPSLVLAVGNIDCSRIVVDSTTFDLSALSGPFAVMKSIEQPPAMKNTTYTIDICKNLERPKSIKEGQNFCPGGTRVCAVEHTINGEVDIVSEVIPIAGDLENHQGGPLDAQITRLKTSSSHSDSEKEGLRVEMSGGIYNGRKQKAIVEFLCNKDRIGTEGNLVGKDGEDAKNTASRRAEDSPKDDDKKDGKNEDGEKKDDEFCMASLSVKSYGPADENSNTDILRMEWETKYACENQIDVDRPSNASWGFFTWFIIIAFMATAAYLIFGSWLNYNRYGARGWDLLPHGDTIRDVPYLLKDWSRKVFNTVQGSGSRGGYSAV